MNIFTKKRIIHEHNRRYPPADTKQDEIRCVLSDLTMPRMNGWDTLVALHKLSPNIPMILSSGYDEAQVMAGEHPKLPNAFLGKPYQLKGL
jgi:CheY-like chemotaxis protein